MKENEESHYLEDFRDNMYALLECYRREGVDGVLDDEHHKAFLIDFGVVFGPTCLPASYFKTIRNGLNSGEKNVMSAVGKGMLRKFSFSSFFVNPLTYDALSGAMALAFVHILNNVDDVIEGWKKDRENMGGIWTSRAAKGTHGIGAVGNVAIAKDGRKAHDDFLKLLFDIKRHSRYGELKSDSTEAWMTNERQNPSKRRKTNAVTQSTVSPTFDLLGSLPVPVDTTDSQCDRVTHFLS